MAKILLDPNQALSAGDRVELHFKSTGMTWLKATQIYLIEQRLEGRTDFELLSVQTETLDPTSLIFVVKVLKSNPILVTALYISAVIAASAATIVFALTFGKAFLIVAEAAKEVVTSPAGKVAIAGTGLALPIIAGILLLGLLKK